MKGYSQVPVVGYFMSIGGNSMHIPDGYLAPQTTIPVLAGMIPVWGISLKKVQRTLNDKQIPSLALGSAFTFVLMMFNIPVAGGSSAHAVGATLIAILLGPWAAAISVSTALLIQALVFGDGGILAFGVNCLNMAVVMPLSGYLVYRLILGKARPGSSRSLIAAFAGGYVGINMAALLAGVELGIQPLLFQSAGGTPLYCPYPLSVSLPAMALTHLAFAGPLEAVVTAATFAYVVKFAPHLLSDRQPVLTGAPEPARPSFLKRYRAVLIPLAVLIVLTPLGLLTSGTAWGEWGGDELQKQLGYIPQGLAAMGDWWHSLLPDYSFSFAEGQAMSAVGYLISAAVGIALISLLIVLTSRLILKTTKEKARGASHHES